MNTAKIIRLKPNTQVKIIIKGVIISTLGTKDSISFDITSKAAIIAITAMFFEAVYLFICYQVEIVITYTKPSLTGNDVAPLIAEPNDFS